MKDNKKIFWGVLLIASAVVIYAATKEKTTPAPWISGVVVPYNDGGSNWPQNI
jgi:uncharacterized membrane protein AbrB (regulator of aidB expression)